LTRDRNNQSQTRLNGKRLSAQLG